jgi:hypothetical protein
MISLLLPSRKRPAILRRMIESALTMATHPLFIEIVVRFDDDDLESAASARIFDSKVYRNADDVLVLLGPRLRKMTVYWNECFAACHGDIVCQANDDIIFTTKGWDVMVETAFAEVQDKIMLAHGSDIFGHGSNFGPHAFVHRKWVETLGYFIPPYFSSDFGDAWINELANMVGRRRYLPFHIEHHHFSQGKADLDENTRERLQRHAEDDPDSLYYSPEMCFERQRDAHKLAALMQRGLSTEGWCPPHSNIRSAGMCPQCGSLSTVAVGLRKFHCNACGQIFVPVTKHAEA